VCYSPPDVTAEPTWLRATSSLALMADERQQRRVTIGTCLGVKFIPGLSVCNPFTTSHMNLQVLRTTRNPLHYTRPSVTADDTQPRL